MHARAVIGVVVAGALAGCAHLPFGHRTASRGGETITYILKGPPTCYGCSTYSITLGPDGQGIFTGEHGTAVSGERRFRASADAVAAFGRALARYRPDGEARLEGAPTCRNNRPDQDWIDVRWMVSDGSSAHLSDYGGCDPKHPERVGEALFSAPSLLPIADLIGPPNPTR